MNWHLPRYNNAQQQLTTTTTRREHATQTIPRVASQHLVALVGFPISYRL